MGEIDFFQGFRKKKKERVKRHGGGDYLPFLLVLFAHGKSAFLKKNNIIFVCWFTIQLFSLVVACLCTPTPAKRKNVGEFSYL